MLVDKKANGELITQLKTLFKQVYQQQPQGQENVDIATLSSFISEKLNFSSSENSDNNDISKVLRGFVELMQQEIVESEAFENKNLDKSQKQGSNEGIQKEGGSNEIPKQKN